jgi:hypothetical protein
MPLSVHEILVPSATRFLGALDKILDKAAEFATRKEIEPAVLLNSRLAPDMFPLTRQVQIACDMIKGGAARLSENEVPKHDDTETTIPELKARIAKVLAFVNGIAPGKFNGGEDRDIVLQMRRGDMKFKGSDYLRDFVLPNFHFHVTAAYAILRHNGVEIGKQDYLGNT